MPPCSMGDGSDARRQREHDAEAGHIEQLGLACLQPLARLPALAFWAMLVVTGAGRDRRVAAGVVLTARDVAAEGCRAEALDGAHNLELGQAQVATVGLTTSGAVVAEDIRNLQLWPGHESRRLMSCAFFLR